jgi:hypothetical protein
MMAALDIRKRGLCIFLTSFGARLSDFFNALLEVSGHSKVPVEPIILENEIE